MKTLTATLSAAQKQKTIKPSVQATLKSNNWPGFVAHAVSILPGTKDGDAVSTGTSIIRVYRDGTTIKYQRITNPDNTSDWYQWQNLVSGVASTVQVAIFYAVSRVVVAWLESNDVKWLYSDDDGATWSAVNNTAYEAPATTSTSVAIGGVSSAATQRAAILIAYDKDGTPDTYHLLLWRYNEATNVWITTVGDYPGTDINEPDSVAGVYRADTDDYAVALLQIREGSTTLRPIKLLKASTSAWDSSLTHTYNTLTTRVYANSNRVFVQLSQTKINGYYWMTFGQAYDDDGFVVYLARSDDGIYWTHHVAVEIRARQFAHVRMLQHGSYIYLLKPAEVWRAALPAADRVATAVRYEFDNERITLVLHDPDGTLSASGDASHLVEGGRVSVERGATTKIGVERVTLHNFSIVEYDVVGKTITIKAETAIARMKRWVSEYTLTWTGTLRVLLERLAAMCDIHTVSVDGAAAWSNTITGFIVTPGTRGGQVLSRLQDYYPFLVDMDGDTLVATVAAASPASTYDFAEHDGVIETRKGNRVTANQVYVFGEGTNLAQAFAYTPASFSRAAHHVDRRLNTLALVQARATAELIVQKELRRVATLTALPHHGAVVGDVVTVDAEKFRIVGIEERYRGRGKMVQVLKLRGTT